VVLELSETTPTLGTPSATVVYLSCIHFRDVNRRLLSIYRSYGEYQKRKTNCNSNACYLHVLFFLGVSQSGIWHLGHIFGNNVSVKRRMPDMSTTFTFESLSYNIFPHVLV
jgi:hypothetical protein